MPRHRQPPRSAFYDLFPEGEAAELEIRALVHIALERWLEGKGMTRAKAAKTLGIAPARISALKCGTANLFSLGLLIRLAARAGLRPRIEFARMNCKSKRSKSRAAGSACR